GRDPRSGCREGGATSGSRVPTGSSSTSRIASTGFCSNFLPDERERLAEDLAFRTVLSGPIRPSKQQGERRVTAGHDRIDDEAIKVNRLRPVQKRRDEPRKLGT